MVTQKNVGRTIRIKDVALKLGISRSSIYQKLKFESNFPRPFSLGERTTVFFENEIDDYLASKSAAR